MRVRISPGVQYKNEVIVFSVYETIVYVLEKFKDANLSSKTVREKIAEEVFKEFVKRKFLR